MTFDGFRLAVFVAVVDRQGYSAAARSLHLSQSTVSHHIAELQKEAGAALLSYRQGRIRLTPAGHEVYRSARIMLGEQESLERAIDNLREGKAVPLRVGASLAFEQPYFIHQFVAPFLSAHPDTMLSLQFGHSGTTAQAVLDHGLDLAYVLNWQLPAEAVFEPLGSAEFTFFAAPDHPLAAQSSVSPEEVSAAGLITAPTTAVETTFYRDILRRSGVSEHGSVLEISGLQPRMLAAEAGLGVVGTFVPAYAVLTGRLVRLTLDRPAGRAEIGLVQRADDEASQAQLTLAEQLRALDHS
ncbi:selenium metabolism-associated LysR family transcriptional regulator [Microbacterium kribbense]|uniref:Selenium metabolism-associated LysR family transcriptional regulator n=1 Tax=Microbacterium kribbense TaxID=433645 RepID=A0ABP7GSI0_9MICO